MAAIRACAVTLMEFSRSVVRRRVWRPNSLKFAIERELEPAVTGQLPRHNRPASLRGSAYRLAATGIILGLGAACGAAWLSWQQQKAELLLNFRATGHAIALSIDHEIGDAIDIAEVLGRTHALEAGDLRGFYAQASAAARTAGLSFSIRRIADGSFWIPR
jgi:hypothetical protein